MDLGLNYLASLSWYVPEAVAVITMIGLLFIESTYDKADGKRFFVYLFGYCGLFLTLYALIKNLGAEPTGLFTNAVILDDFSTIVKIIMVIGTAAAIHLSSQSSDIYKNLKAEYVIMSVGVMIGGMLLASANNMLTLYLGIETLSILSYVMASMKKNDETSSEAGLKYALYGGISAGIMLFGMSHIFGVLGTIQFSEVATQMEGLNGMQLAVLLPSFLLFFAGISYKIACFPFHMWSPDVYEGSPLPVTAFFAIVPKMAGIAVLVRVTHVFFLKDESIAHHTWIVVLSLAAAMTMTVGNVAAIGQRSVKRMLAYSSIAHAGNMILGAVVIDEIGNRAILFYGVTYLFMTLVAFYIVGFVADKYGNDHFERFSGLIYKHPLMAVSLSMVMFSLAGIPPMSGFVAKFNILSAVLNEKHYVLAIVAGLNSVVSLYYYLKIVRLMVFKNYEATDGVSGFTMANQAIVSLMVIPVLMLGIFWEKLLLVAKGAKIFIQ